MAKNYIETDQKCRDIKRDVSKGKMKPIYLLMGDEPFYSDLVADYMIENVIDPTMQDFNRVILYGTDTDAETVIDAARRYPVMSDFQLVVIKEAQAMKSLEKLAFYCENPLSSTILVICMHGTLDKRKSLYKNILKRGVVIESKQLRDYEVPGWITYFYQQRGLTIENRAAELLAEAAGTDMSRIAAETDKMLKNHDEDSKVITVSDIEENVGISRDFSIFELTKELSYVNRERALYIAARVGATPKFAMPMAVSALFLHFNRILRYGALLMNTALPSKEQMKEALSGVNPFFYKEYDEAIRHYPVPNCMGVISLLKEYDYRGKGGAGIDIPASEQLKELICAILSSAR